MDAHRRTVRACFTIAVFSSGAMLAICILAAPITPLRAQNAHPTASSTTAWPTHGWTKGTPASAGLDQKILSALDADLASGKYSLVDSFAVFRCGAEVFEKTYPHDYGTIYAKEAKTRWPLNAHLTGPDNYFDPPRHPYYHPTDLHTTQSRPNTPPPTTPRTPTPPSNTYT